MIFRPVEAGVAVRAADHKLAGGVDVDMLHVLHLEAVLGQHGGNDVVMNVGADLLHGVILPVHHGDNHGVDAGDLAVLVIGHADLGLAVGPQAGVLGDAGGERFTSARDRAADRGIFSGVSLQAPPNIMP